MVINWEQRSHFCLHQKLVVTKEFVITMKQGSHAVPSSSHEACFGAKQAPITPHRQRLLVACNKAARVAASRTPGAKSKAKANPPGKKTPQAKQAKAKASPPDVKNTASETGYTVAKKQFLATLPGLKLHSVRIMTMCPKCAQQVPLL